MRAYQTATVRAPTRGLIEQRLSEVVVGAFFEVYNSLGYGFLESHHKRALVIALRRRGVSVETEHEVMVRFQGEDVGLLRLDLFVERRIVVEVKSTERLADAHWRQLRNYVAAASVELGLLLHFGPYPRFFRVLARQRQK